MRAFEKLTTDATPGQNFEPHASGLYKYKQYLQAREDQRSLTAGSSSASSAAMAIIGTATAMGSFTMDPRWLKEYIVEAPYDPDHARDYADKLGKLDSELGRNYRGISEAFFGLTENAERVAFGLARQCFDHLFSVLVPDDDDVRRSQFFQEKDGDKPNAVSRIERMKFAASTRIPDGARAELLIEGAAKFFAAYDDLQRLHARKPIDRDRARAVLRTFIAEVDQWVDALQL